jgi:putative membrane protein
MTLETRPQEQKSIIRLLLSGFAMGAADVVPGVSGGTIAFILGIYEDLLHAIHDINFDFIRRILKLQWREAFTHPSIRFLIALGSGLAIAVLTVSRLLVWGLEHYPQLIWAFFFGLVLASVVVIIKRVRRWTAATVALAVAGTVFAYLLVGLTPVETPNAAWFLFLSGALAISAMILPGISGAFIMLILGKYQYLLESLVTGNWLPLIIVGAGAVVGLLSFARLLRWLFAHYHDLTVAVLIGLVMGALRKVWPWKEVSGGELTAHGESLLTEINVLPAGLTLEVGLAIGMMLAGFLLVIMLEYFGKRQQPLASEHS